MSVRLVVDNPTVVRSPRPLSRTEQSRRGLEAEYRRGLRYTAATELPSAGCAKLIVWPNGSMWKLLYRVELAGGFSVGSDAGLYPSRLAAFDHGAACIRRAAAGLTRSTPTDAEAIVRWLDSLKVPT